jgi:NAD(P)-dependent dehydrogenase (short-subunit alcohol dehydrogenase family)
MSEFPVRFVDRVAVVTGGAKGIGRACALRFACEGARVAVLDVLAEESASTVREIEALGREALSIACDVRDEGQLAAAVKQILAAWDRIDVWVNNAGVYSSSPLLNVSQEDWDHTVGTNFSGVFLGCRAVAPVMREQQSGRIINVSSMAAQTSWPAAAGYSAGYAAGYAASKSAVIGLTRSVALDMASSGVTVNAVCPGNTLTDTMRQVAATAARREGLTADEWLQRRARDCALGRLATPEEIAGSVAFLASDDARYVTGQSISIDGGMVL